MAQNPSRTGHGQATSGKVVMNGPFVVAQANSTSSGATPVQVIKLFKPTAGHTEIFHASFSGVVKIDFSAIANEKITLFHDSKNQSLHIIFADGSQDIIEPFFDSRGVLSNLLLDMRSSCSKSIRTLWSAVTTAATPARASAPTILRPLRSTLIRTPA